MATIALHLGRPRNIMILVMEVEKKLDEIIALLKSIDSKLLLLDKVSLDSVNRDNNMSKPVTEKPIKPTPRQVQTIRAFELANRLDRSSYLKFIRKDIAEILERQKIDPYYPVFKPQSLTMLSKQRGNNAPAYRGFAEKTRLFADAVTKEGIILIKRLKQQLEK